MSRLFYLDEEHVENIVETLTRDVFPGTPAFQLAGAEGAERLQSALAQPRWPHHRTAQRKAAALHYSLNNNHPYVDGNKRLAVTAMEWFLWMNDFWLLTTNEGLFNFALAVADDRLDRDQSAKWIEARAVRLTWTDERRTRWLQALSLPERTEILEALAEGRPFVVRHTARFRPWLEEVALFIESSA